MDQQKDESHICVLFFGSYNYAWLNHLHMYPFVKSDAEFSNENEKSIKKAIIEAEKFLVSTSTTKEQIINGNEKRMPFPYVTVKTNTALARTNFRKCRNVNEYFACNCFPNGSDTCINDKCFNVYSKIECAPELCNQNCKNQHFGINNSYKLQIKLTDAKGWGLFAKENMPSNMFVIEYVGEIIDKCEMERRFISAIECREEHFYFVGMNSKLFIDGRNYGNESRFINHSCDPNTVLEKWTAYSGGEEKIRLAFFTKRQIIAGEEITFDYQYDSNYKKTECLCGAISCRKLI